MAPRWLVEGGFVLVAILVGLFGLVAGGRSASRRRAVDRAARPESGWPSTPLGTAMWVVHFGFHLVTGWPTAEAAMTRVATRSRSANGADAGSDS